MSEDEAAAAARLDRPLIVYVYDDAEQEDARFLTEKHAAFANGDVAVGARFFDCARIDLESAKNDGVLRKAGVKRPGLVFVRPNLEVAATMSVRFKAPAIFRTMCKALRMDYDNSAATVLKKQRTLNKARLKLDKERGKLDRLEAKINDEDSDKKRNKLQKERDKLADKIAEAEAKLDEKEQKLYGLKPKTPDA